MPRRRDRERAVTTLTIRRNFGHSMWLGAGQAAACRNPSRIALN
jgi:hypothetical protein